MQQRRTGDGEFWRAVLFGALAGAVITFAALLIFALILTLGNMTDVVAVPFSLCAAAAGAFAGGWVASRIYASRGLVLGAATGGALFLINFLVSAIVSAGGVTNLTLAKLAVIMLSALVGGVFGVNSGAKRKMN